ncbi:MAG: hypothetical protein H6669_12210 [Ardenticatenaceae bacterium]|nr:hypothetical protein [Ardenticatenaceae bacterium]
MAQSLSSYNQLRRLIFDLFDEEELRSLCFDLDVNYDGLSGKGTEAKSRELILFMRRRQRLGELLTACRQARPEADWPDEIAESRLAPVTPMWWPGEPQQFVIGAVLIIVLLAVLIGVISWPKGTEPAIPTQEVVAATKTATAVPTKPSTPTATLPPTNTPTPAPPPDVTIVEFEPPPNRFVKVAPLLEENLLDTLDEYDLQGVNVQVVDQPITSRDEAETLAATSGSKVVIWGWYDDLGINVRIYLTSDMSQSRTLLRTSAVPLVSAEEGDTELALRVVNDVLPDNVTFLSLFVIGQLEYQANEYQKGYAAFDAAMANLPETVVFENPALLHFFRGRQMEAAGSDDKDTIACEYSQAITADPEFAPAYNNLGILLAQLGAVKVPDSIKACLTVDLPAPWESGEYLPDGFDIAAYYFYDFKELQPESAVARYNILAFAWSAGGYLPDDIKQELDAITELDPSMPGPYIMRAMLAYNWSFGQPDYGAIEGELETAVILLPDVPELCVTLGQIYALDSRLEDAEAALQAALAIDGQNWEGLLALANLAYRQEGSDAAKIYLAQIPTLDEAFPPSAAGSMFAWPEVFDTEFMPISPFYMADLFRSQLLFEAGDASGAAESIDKLLGTNEQLAQVFDLSPIEPPYERYLAGLLESLNTGVSTSQTITVTFPVVAGLELNRLATSIYAWQTLLFQCNSSGASSPDRWGTARNDCLPEDLTERITAVYEIFHDHLDRRMNYQMEGFFGGLACPYVFTYNEASKTWALDTTIIYGLVGPENETTQQRPLQHFDGRLLIREIEPETSYLDQVYVMAVAEDGRRYILQQELPALQSADENYLILHQGDSQWLHFPGFASLENIQQFWVVARGYYEPLPFSHSSE